VKTLTAFIMNQRQAGRAGDVLRSFFVRPDAEYDYYEGKYQAKTGLSKTFYIFMYFLPGILAYTLINQKTVFDSALRLTGLSGGQYQYVIFISVTFGIHIVLPFLALMYADGLSLRQTLGFLSMNKFDWKGAFVVAPLFLLAFVLLSYPYMLLIGRPLRGLLVAVPAFVIPEHSIFTSYEKMFAYSGVQILFMLVGNHIGEELYYRGYLLKKTAFLGEFNWVLNGIFFALYHIWQIPQTWPLFGLNILFGLLMVWRKNTYVLTVFHFLTNYAWPFLFVILFGSSPYG
jgi:membrane protease YdiL (CAAX protease family)